MSESKFDPETTTRTTRQAGGPVSPFGPHTNGGNIVECINALTAAIANRQWGTALIETGHLTSSAGELYNNVFPPTPAARGAAPTKRVLDDSFGHIDVACQALNAELVKFGEPTAAATAVAAFDFGKIFAMIKLIMELLANFKMKALATA